MKINNDQELIEAIKQFYTLKDLEDELERKLAEVNQGIYDYLKYSLKGFEKTEGID